MVETKVADPAVFLNIGIGLINDKKQAKADLEKYVSIAPADAPDLAPAKKILETIK